MAAERLSLDCSAHLAPDIPTLLNRLRQAAASRAPGDWVRATGFDEAFVAERRLPTIEELDDVAPDTPLVLHHRSGHLQLRNAAAGDDPAPAIDGDELADAMRGISIELARAGVVELHDASPSNVDDWRLLSRWVDELVITQELTVMPGVAHLDAFAEAGLHHGARHGHTTVGPAKVLNPPQGIDAAVRAAHERDWPVAVHVMEIDELGEALGVVGPGDRLEHVALSLPEQVDRIARSGATVVTQPSFLVHRRTKYLEQLTPTEHAWLYRVRSLLDAGVPVHLSSDAPVVPADPDDIVRGAVERELNPAEAVDVDTARALLAPTA